jgi:hypothetical protein
MSITNDQIGSDMEFSDQHSVEELTLIKGTFTPSEAKEVLMELINSKLSFHNKKNLRSYELTGSEDRDSQQRILDLEKMRKQLLMVLKNADDDGMSVGIETQIHIEFLDGSE